MMKRTPLALALTLATVPAFSATQILEEVIVTAQKKEETLTSAPVAVSLVDGEEIKDLSFFQADELNRLVSGLEIRFEGDTNVGVGLRGTGTFQQQSAPARVGVYMDDYYMASQAAFALSSIFDMASVQILRGPQGTLYGQPSPTGALVLNSADPNFDGVNGYVQGSYLADPEGFNIQGAVNIPLLDDQLALRLAGLSDERETGTENINPVNSLDEERNRDGLRAKLLWQPTDTFSARLGAHYMRTDDADIYRIVERIDAGEPGFDPAAAFDVEADDRKAVADAPSFVAERDEVLTTLHLDWMVGDVELQWFSGNLHSEQDIRQDQDRTEVPSVLLNQTTDYGDDWGAYQHELRVSGTAFDRWDWTVGGYYSEVDSVTAVDTFANRPTDGGVFNIVIDIPLKTDTRAIFTHNTLALTPDTEVTFGLRYNEFEQSDGTVLTGDFFIGSMLEPGGAITEPAVVFEDVFPCIDGSAAPCSAGAGDFGWEEWTGTIKLSHFFSDALNLYGTYDRGFRPGAPNFDTSGVFQPDLNFYDGESVDSFEIGAKGDLFHGRARYTAAVFYSLYEDYQAQAVGLTAFNTVTGEVEIPTNAPFVNVDEAVQQGFEADFRMLVTDAWTVYAGVTYANVEFTDGAVPCTDPSQPPVGPGNRFNTCDADGETASAQPEWTGVLQSEYSWNNLAFGSDFYVSGLWSYKGDTEAPGDIEGRLDTGSFSVLDLYAGLRNQNWSAQLFLKNAFDEDGVLSKRPLAGGYNEITVTPPQTVGLTASYNF